MIQYAQICDSFSKRLLIFAVSGMGVSIYSNLDSTYPGTRLCDCMLGIRCQDRSLPSFGQNNGGLLDSEPRLKLVTRNQRQRRDISAENQSDL